MGRLTTIVAAATVFSAAVVSAQGGPSIAKCSLNQKCPESAPCCSQYGDCGKGAYCLGGCDPRMSFGLDSCVPAPVCKDKTMDMKSLDKIVNIEKYLGDSSKADWVASGEPLLYNGNTLLTMTPESSGTVIASTVDIWYGTVKAKMKTSRGNGVVTAFILLSNVKDEIDYEWVGNNLTNSQTNYYFQGILDYTQSGNISNSDTFANFHEYEIEWTPDYIKWKVDGKTEREKKKSETWNATGNRYEFPQSPSRLQLSIWPGGSDKNPKGTVDWAGGAIDWKNHEDLKNNGYYYTTLSEISIQCHKADKGQPGSHSGTSYYFKDAKATNDTVVDSDKPTILKSMLGTGTDMNAGADPNKSSEPVAVIPGGGIIGQGSNGEAAGNANGGGGGTAGAGGGGGGAAGSDKCQGGSTGFTQDCAAQNNPGGASSPAPKLAEGLGASAFAVVIALAGMLML